MLRFERLRKSWKFGFYLRSFGVSRRELAEWGDTLCADRLSQMLGGSEHVGRAVVLALDGAVDGQGNLDPAADGGLCAERVRSGGGGTATQSAFWGEHQSLTSRRSRTAGVGGGQRRATREVAAVGSAH